jgi:3-methyladenine DNA glycosylase AlkD
VHASEAFFRRRFRQLGTLERARGEKAYLKSPLDFHGVTQPQIRAAARDWCREHPELDRSALRESVAGLFATTFHDLRSAGIALLERKTQLLEARDADWLIELVRRSGNWAHVDWIAAKVLGDLVAREPKLLAKLPRWAKDSDFWVRRTALLAQLDALRSGGGDFALFSQMAIPLLEEKEFFIRKAIGWVLRDTSKKRPALVRDFLLEHGARAAGLTLREASRHLPANMLGEIRGKLNWGRTRRART